MTDEVADDKVQVLKQRTPSLVWLFPLVAAVIVAWLVFTTFASTGPKVQIVFKTAEGLEAGKTAIKYKDVEVGLVKEIRISEDLQQILVTAEMGREMGPYLSEGTRFWVVRPRLTASGISGFGTLVSGAYIEVDPVEGQLQAQFTGLETPPLVRSGDAGREFLLTAETLGSINRSSPIFYRGVQVGEVLDHALSKDFSQIDVRIFVKSPYDTLIRPGTTFWNASGVSAQIDATGVRVDMQSLASLVAGGVAFQTSDQAMQEPPAAQDTRYRLYENRRALEEEQYAEKYSFVAYFDSSVRGLSKGAPVEFKGIRVGTVTNVHLELDTESLETRVPVFFNIEPQRFLERSPPGKSPLKGPLGQLASPADVYKTVNALVEKGLRAQLQMGSILTGQLLVDLEVYEDVEPSGLIYGGPQPEMPTRPSDLDVLAASVNNVIQKVAALPLDQLIDDLRNTIRSVGALTRSPEIARTLRSLDHTLKGVDRIVNEDVGPLVKSLRQTSDAAQGAVGAIQSSIGEGSVAQHNLVQLLDELTRTARSFRTLADTLEQNPEALIRGKGGTE